MVYFKYYENNGKRKKREHDKCADGITPPVFFFPERDARDTDTACRVRVISSQVRAFIFNGVRSVGKDPAFLFYPNDWLGGTMTFTRAQKGAYVDLMMAQFNQWELSLTDIKLVLGTDFWMWETKLSPKFDKDEDGLYFNQRLRKEMVKRRLFTDSRHNNKEGTNQHRSYDLNNDLDNLGHMGNRNGNRNEKDVGKNGYDFEILWFIYPKKLGKKEAERHFKASVKNDQDYVDIKTALNNFKSSRAAKGDPQFIPHGSTFFNNWRDWIEMPETEKVCPSCNNKGKFISTTGYEIVCKCRAGNGKSLK